MSREFEGRTALVTGGSRGIGRAICEQLAAGGASIAVNYRGNEAAALATRDAIRAAGGRAEAYQADVADAAAVGETVASIERALGPVDLLVTSAGLAGVASHRETTLEDFQRIMRTNVDGTFIPVMAVKDAMIERGYGRIVCIASIAALRPRGRMLAYSTSKAAVVAFARSAAEAFAPAVRVNTVAPGLVETDMTANMDPALKASMLAEAWLGRHGRPEDIAEAVAFLLSDRSDFISGQTLVADGGRVTLP